ncbi:MAG: SDR family oxidoreductase [Rubellimicrobium sp.]|nr:SDR family oxidoreductase [Rubellimicrobium sp.]
MDLGLKGRRALVCAASRGLGRGIAAALAAEGVSLVLNARGAAALDATAAELRAAHGVPVVTVAGDITDAEARAAVLAVADDPDILITNAGGPPPGSWCDWSRDDLDRAVGANMLTPVLLMQACLPAMIARGWGRVVNVTSSSVRAPIPELGLSNMARTGLTGAVAGIARQVAAHGVTVNNLLPGRHATDRIAALDQARASADGISEDEVRARARAGNPTGQDGDPADFGAVAAFLCSRQARFIVGQNILVDGGGVALTM